VSPLRAKTPCRGVGCAALVRPPGYCPKCETKRRKASDDRRGSASSRGYGSRWRRVRLVQLAKEPLCRMCADLGTTTAAREVDHIDGDPRNNNRRNLRSLCKSCHSARTGRDQGAFGRSNPKENTE